MAGNLRLFTPVLLVLPLLAASIPSAMADVTAGPSGELTVKGQYIPVACEAVLASNGTIDYGHIQSSSLNNEKTTDLPVKTLASAITINCPTATSVAFSIVDNRVSSVITPADPAARMALLPNSNKNEGVILDKSTAFLGLGVDSSAHAIGNYVAQFSNVKIDGAKGSLSSGFPLQSSVSPGYDGVYLYPLAAITAATNFQQPMGGFGSLAVGKVFVMDYQVQATIEPAKNLDLTKEITLDGSVTVSFYYL